MILKIASHGSGKTNALINLQNHPDKGQYSVIDNIYLYVKDLFEPKYQFLQLWNTEMIQGSLSNIQTLWVMFTMILAIKIQKKKIQKFLIVNLNWWHGCWYEY